MKERIYKLSPETRAKMSIAKTGSTHSEETKAKIAAAHKGGRLSNEHKANISAAMTGRKRKPFTEETKAKMRDAQAARRAKEAKSK